MQVRENRQYSTDYLDPNLRSIANAVQVFFADGTKTDKVEVHFPIGHRRRRTAGIPVLREKVLAAFSTHYGRPKTDEIMQLFASPEKLDQLPVHEFMSLLRQ